MPSTWRSTFIFFATNYLAYAASVKCLPGEQLWSYMVVVTSAILYPYSGIVRRLESIYRGTIFSSDPIKLATRAGAFCIVIRAKNWEPGGNQQPIAGVTVRDVKQPHFLAVHLQDIELGNQGLQRYGTVSRRNYSRGVSLLTVS